MITLPPFMNDQALRKRIQKRILAEYPRGWRQAQQDHDKYGFYSGSYGKTPPAEAVRLIIMDEIYEWHGRLLFKDMEAKCEL